MPRRCHQDLDPYKANQSYRLLPATVLATCYHWLYIMLLPTIFTCQIYIDFKQILASGLYTTITFFLVPYTRQLTTLEFKSRNFFSLITVQYGTWK